MAAASCLRGCIELTLDLVTVSALDLPTPLSVATSADTAAVPGAHTLQRRPPAQSTGDVGPPWGGVDVRTVVSALGLALGPDLHVELVLPRRRALDEGSILQPMNHHPAAAARGSSEGRVAATRTSRGDASGRGHTGEGRGGGEEAPRSGLRVQVEMLGAGVAGPGEGPWLSELQPRLLTVRDAAGRQSTAESSGTEDAVALRARILQPLAKGEARRPLDVPSALVRSGGAFLPVRVAAWGRAPGAAGLIGGRLTSAGEAGASRPALGMVAEEDAAEECGAQLSGEHAHVLYDEHAYEVYDLELSVGQPHGPGVVLLELTWPGQPATSAVPVLVLRAADAEVAAELAAVLEAVPPLLPPSPPSPTALVSQGPGGGPDGGPDGGVQPLQARPLDGLLLDLGVWAQAAEAAPGPVAPLQLAALAGSLLRFTGAVGLHHTRSWAAAGAERLGLRVGQGPEFVAEPAQGAPMQQHAASPGRRADEQPPIPESEPADAVVEVEVEAEECKLPGGRCGRQAGEPRREGPAAPKGFPAHPQRTLGSVALRALQRALGLQQGQAHGAAPEVPTGQPHAELAEHVVRAAAVLCVLCALLLFLWRGSLLGGLAWDLLPETAWR